MKIRTKFKIAEIQIWLEVNNTERPNPDYRNIGRCPIKTSQQVRNKG